MLKQSVFYYVFILVIILVNFGADQWTKEIAKNELKGKGTVFVLDTYVVLRFTENQGAFLSIGSGLPERVRRILLSALPLILIIGVGYVLFFRNAHLKWIHSIALSFVVGGGLGNMVDRIMYDGKVVDFINVGINRFRTGIFNTADLSIMAGGIMIVLGVFFNNGNEAKI